MSGTGVQARVPLVGMLLLSLMGIAFTAAVKATTVSNSVVVVNGSGQNVTISGTAAQCSGFGSCVGKITGFIWDSATFNIDGAPLLLRFVVSGFYLATFILGLLAVLGIFSL